MTKQQHTTLWEYAKSCAQDNVHDSEHVRRVCSLAVYVAKQQPAANFDVVVASALLHDNARCEEEGGMTNDHAALGATKAEEFLRNQGYEKSFCAQVKACILTHSHSRGGAPQSLEAKILYDADKLDLTGAIGVARALQFGAQIGEPLYTLGQDDLPALEGQVHAASFLREYSRKLQAMPEVFYTQPAIKLARQRQTAMDDFVQKLKEEVRFCYAQMAATPPWEENAKG